MTTQAKHTPGPWRWSRYYDERNAESYRAAGIEQTRCLGNDGEAFVTVDGGRIAVVDMQRDDVKKKDASRADDPERDANARLVAAAPDLLAACKVARHLLEGAYAPDSPRDLAVRQLKAALAKAEPKGE